MIEGNSKQDDSFRLPSTRIRSVRKIQRKKFVERDPHFMLISYLSFILSFRGSKSRNNSIFFIDSFLFHTFLSHFSTRQNVRRQTILKLRTNPYFVFIRDSESKLQAPRCREMKIRMHLELQSRQYLPQFILYFLVYESGSSII